METRSNYILVGVVTLALIAALVGFTIWLAKFNDGEKKEYDIFFQQSVNGLSKGSSVSFSGVPVGEVKDISLWAPDPEFVRVRIAIEPAVPILQGTTATINSLNFTGVADIQLDGAVKGAPAITCPKEEPESACPAGVPVIPTRPGALGQLLNGAPLLLERLSTLTERLTNLMSDKNQESIEKTLANVETITSGLKTTGPTLEAAISESRATIAQASVALGKLGGTADQMSSLANNVNTTLTDEGKPAIAELKKTLAAANKSLSALEVTLKSSNPAIETLNTQTLPEFNQLARDLRQLSGSLKSITERVDQNGLGGALSAPPLPDYDAKKGKLK
jgi:phospholipid/cholesterol/gamma-HCH transport system substrate-binding protein